MTSNARRSILLLIATAFMTAASPVGRRGLVVDAKADRASDPAPLTVHEWGTFTSIAGEDGGPVDWLPLSGPQDLPCFVNRIRLSLKGSLSGTVRMETPVVYLYAPADMTVNVSVLFRQGIVTEWFPRASVRPPTLESLTFRKPDLESRITWKDVKVSPRATPDYPTEGAPSHYYAARLTDASPLQSGSEQEKFLFYRGVGRFAPPLTAAVAAGGRVDVRTLSGEPMGPVILFENRGGRIGYQVEHAKTDRISIGQPALENGDLTSLRNELERMLVAQGLYPKEASAMVETWRDSWFEEGTRLFYIASKQVVNSILPLEISPMPTEVARVFVGRMELVTPRMMQEVKEAVLEGNRTAFTKYGRFVQPIASRIIAASAPAERAVFEERLKAAYASYYASLKPVSACG